MRGSPLAFASVAAARTKACTRGVSGGCGGMMYQIFSASEPWAAWYRTAARTVESSAM